MKGTTPKSREPRDATRYRKVNQVIDYLDDLLRLRSKPVYDVATYAKVLWIGQSPIEWHRDRKSAKSQLIPRECITAAHSDQGDILRIYEDQHRDAFEALFEIQQRLRGDGDSHELVLGSALLSGQHQKQGRLLRHLLTSPVELHLEDGAIVVRSSAYATIRLELDMLDRSSRTPDDSALISQLRGEAPEDLVDPRFAEQWSTTLASTLQGSLSLLAGGIHDAPALLLRPRPTQAAAQVLHRLREETASGGSIQPLLLDVAESTPSQSPSTALNESPSEEGAPTDGSPEEAGRPLFPLPTNPEQREVFDRTRTQAGVLVQGPPGTGKTHTIANLVTHFLATNQRVLVTAKNPRALRVLRDQLPDEVKPLCISSLGSGPMEQRELEGSIRSLTDRHARLDRRRNDQRILALKDRLRRTEAEESELRGRWLFARRAETNAFDLGGGWKGTPTAIGRRLDREAELNWIPDAIPMDFADSSIDAGVFAASLKADGPSPTHRDRASVGEHLPTASDEELAVLLAASDAIADGSSDQERDVDTRSLETAQENLRAVRGRLVGLLERARIADRQHLDPGGVLDLRTLIQQACDQRVRGPKKHRRWFGLLPGRERAIDRVRLDGRRATDPEMLVRVLAHLETRRDIALLWKSLTVYGQRPQGTLAEQVTAAELLADESEERLQIIQSAHGVLTQHGSAAVRSSKQPGSSSRGPRSKTILDAGRLAKAELLRRQETRARRQQKSSREILGSALPILAKQVAAADDGTTAAPGSATEFDAAIQYARARTWYQEHLRIHDEVALERRMALLEDRRRQLTAELAASLGWKHLLDGMTEDQRRHLIAWRQAMGRYAEASGSRTSKNDADAVETHRRDARRHLAGCRPAIGAWVLPIDQVFESIDPVKSAFDVVIIDEASQCGQHALPILNYAPRVIVVGDQQQIRPVPVGIAHADVDRLMSEHLQDFIHRDAFLPTQSLLDHAARRFGDPITLREHFRCVPEIIRFSDELCYEDAPLLALRRPDEGRLDPLRSLFVSDGERTGEGAMAQNLPEAAAIAKSIRTCLDDPAYDGRSFGVIVMQGKAQAKAIEKELMKRLTPAEIEGRKLSCGTPYSFQGDERDVIWISLVAANNRKNAVMVREDFVRRFNVAMSRARDQVWLAHSVAPDDLSEKDLRRRLLDHFIRSADTQDDEVSPITREYLAADLEGTDRSIASPAHPFETWLQVDVAADLVADGYTIIPREISGDLLPLSVEYRNRVVVVECVDETQSPEEAARRLERRMILERCGWQFFAVRASEYSADQERVLADLREALDDAGIQSSNSSHTIDRQGGSKDHGSKDHGSKDHGPKDHGSKDHGSKDHGPKDHPRGGVTSDDLDSDRVPSRPAVRLPIQPEEAEGPRSLLDEDPPEGDDSREDNDSHEETDHDLFLEPYVAWDDRTLPPPRADDLGATIQALVEITEVEGPAVCSRIFRKFAESSGFSGVTPGVGLLLDEATRQAIAEGRLVSVNDATDPDFHTVRVPGQPDLMTRTRGDRRVEELPPSEIRQVASFIERSRPRASRDRIHRSVLRVFDVSPETAGHQEIARVRSVLSSS